MPTPPASSGGLALGSLSDAALAPLRRLWSWVGDIGVDDIWPTHYHADALDEQIRHTVRQAIDTYRRRADQIRQRQPHADAADWVDELFRPFVNRALRMTMGHEVLDVIPLSLLWGDAARVHRERSLLGRQIELVASATVLCEPDWDADAVADEVLAVLDQVHGLRNLRNDLRGRGLMTRAGKAGTVGLGKLMLRKTLGMLALGKTALGVYARYSRFRKLRDAIVHRAWQRGCR